MSQVFTISQFVGQVKQKLEKDQAFSSVSLEGEVSNFSCARTNHWYFSLKDDQAKLSCIMFSFKNKGVPFKMQDGLKVQVQGSLTLYAPSGGLSFQVDKIQKQGAGNLYEAFLALRNELHQAGYFHSTYKKPIPSFPLSIGILVGKDSAAQADILRTLKARWPLAKVMIYPCLVQGEKAASDLIYHLEIADKNHHDVLIVARGGGSFEDLNAFNDRALALKVFACKTPIISGVGHEVDITIIDYVADLRALTPTDAAIKATPKLSDVLLDIDQLDRRLFQGLQVLGKDRRHKLLELIYTSPLGQPDRFILPLQKKLDQVGQHLHLFSLKKDSLKRQLSQMSQDLLAKGLRFSYQQQTKVTGQRQRLVQASDRLIQSQQRNLDILSKTLNLVSPHKLLEKGYILSRQNGHVISRRDNLNPNALINLQYLDGSVQVRLERKENNDI